jgi:glycosyltransferase involved in cell wall biosynthesis
VTVDSVILVGPLDTEGFVKAVVSLLEDEARRIKIGSAAKKRVEEFFALRDKVRIMEDAILAVGGGAI